MTNARKATGSVLLGMRSPDKAALAASPARIWGPRLVLLLLFGVSWLHQGFHDFQHDDAFISYRYALNWAEGHGPVFNVGERVEGYSNFLLVACLALGRRLGGDVVFISRLAGTLACWGVIALVYDTLRSRLRRGAGVALAGAGAAALHSGLSLWARGGLETVPNAFLVMLAAFVFLGEHEARVAHLPSGLLFGVLALLRADGLLYFGATVLYLLVRRAGWTRIATLAIPCLALAVPHLLWRWSYYGDLLPNSYYLKTGGDFFQQLRGLFYTYNFVVPFGGLLLFGLPLLLIGLRDPRRDPARLYFGLIAVTLTSYIVWIGGDHMPLSRLYMPIVAPIIVLSFEAAIELTGLAHPAGPSKGRGGFVCAVLLSLIALSGFLPSLNPRRPPYSHAIQHKALVERWTLAGRWLRQNTSSGTLLATDAAGAIPFYSGLKTIDMLGVNDRHIAHLSVPNMGHGTAGHEKRDFAYVLSRRPDIIFRDVRDQPCGAERMRTYPDGSVYGAECASLGPGPQASEFGEIAYKPLFIWYEKRQYPEPR